MTVTGESLLKFGMGVASGNETYKGCWHRRIVWLCLGNLALR